MIIMAKIGVIINSLYACGGEERVVSIMANEWAKRHDITIFTFENREAEGENRNDYYLSDKIKIERVHDSKIHLGDKIIRLLYYYTGMTKGKLSGKLLKHAYYPNVLLEEWIERINSAGFDIVIGISGIYTMLLGYIADQISARTICWEHSSFEGYFHPRKGYYRNREALYRQCADRLDARVVLNGDIQKKYMEKLQLNTVVIPNPKSFSSPDKADMKNKCFVACGRLEAEKAYDDLITAFYYFIKENSDWTLIIIGGGSLRKLLEEQVRKYRIENRVLITGYVHNVRELLLNGSIFVMTSRWEGFPMSVTEALELGLPVISYDLPALEPLVTDGVEGRIVPSYNNHALVDAMKELASDQEKRIRMSKAAIRKAEIFSVELIAQQWEDLFEGVLNNPKAGRREKTCLLV